METMHLMQRAPIAKTRHIPSPLNGEKVAVRPDEAIPRLRERERVVGCQVRDVGKKPFPRRCHPDRPYLRCAWCQPPKQDFYVSPLSPRPTFKCLVPPLIESGVPRSRISRGSRSKSLCVFQVSGFALCFPICVLAFQ